ncbi:transketolase C-terminal domain-containing protein [Mycobacterium sp. 236(2023)]|uniref:alpha-ketoacid dehydrogenase subunit beta n=1 Tax=Mycobacterium sp. 236(2023) TaxID=3038163 RepID=UPI002414E338|nr:transketolase C-terminal domain-containing protein [Mycobacterium sp. 236(2023)]MDG4668265.1 transketolase C-terminal domain-containing protein [Mycobacterium sp. 236(2023)]
MTITRAASLADSINGALHRLMDDDDAVVLIGQDIGALGGVFRVTRGLQERFGRNRVRDAVLAESSIVGQAIGMAMSGLKPVCEIQFEGFVYPAMNQIVTQAARIPARWGGDMPLHLVIRIPVGGGIRAVEHHSESNEALFAHSAGLHVAYPSSPDDAADMLHYAVNLGTPVVFFEPKRLYWNRRLQSRDAAAESPEGARIVRAGGQHPDVTVAGYGAMLDDVLRAAQTLEGSLDVEVVDLRWIAPMDIDTVVASVARSGRLLVVHEAVEFCGVGAELVAAVTERAWDTLRTPPRRLAPQRRTYPPAHFEKDYLIDVADIVSAIEGMCR